MNQAVKIEPTQNQAPSSSKEGGVPALAVIGQNGNDTPRGAWFTEAEIEVAGAGASQMGMHAIRVTTPETIALANKLPRGRTFDSGKLFTPKIQATVFDQLLQYIPGKAASAKPISRLESKVADQMSVVQSANDFVAEGTRPKDWSEIKIGSLVLAEEAPADGWFEAIVLKAKSKDVFELKWRDYPDEPLIERHHSRLALMMQLNDRSKSD